MVIKADSLTTEIENNADKFSGGFSDVMAITKLSFLSTVEEFAKEMVLHHKPSQVSWKAKFGIKEEIPSPESLQKSKYYCAECKKTISEKEVKFCWNNKAKFGGRAFCYQ